MNPLVFRLGLPLSANGQGAMRPGARLGITRPFLGQSTVLDSRAFGLVTNGLAAALGVTAGLTFKNGWRVVGWLVALAAGIRAWNDLTALSK